MKSILTIVIFLSLVVSGATQTRNVVVGTNGAVVSPTNFWSADVTNARSGLGLGSAATSAATAFQPSSVNLSNLASNNGLSLTNVQASNIVGVISITSPVVNFTNITGTLSVAQGGTSATNAANARQNLGATTVGNALFIATNAAAARTAIGATAIGSSVFTAVDEAAARTFLFLGSAATNAESAFQPSSIVLSNLSSSNGASLTNIPVAGVVGALATNGSAAGLVNFPTVALASNVTGTIAISNGGSGSTTAGGARTNLGLGATNDVQFNTVNARGIFDGTNEIIDIENNWLNYVGFGATFEWGDTANITLVPFAFGGTNSALNTAITRTNLSLGWSALTNTNTSGFNTSLYGSGTNPVLYSTNGEVVSPTNFWQVAPIVTRFVESQPVVSQTTNITAARNLHIHSLAISTTGVTNTIALPTTNSFNGDIALVVHQGPTSSVTQVRTQGSTNNLVTMNRTEEAVEFVYYNSVWQFNHNQSFVEPIYFSGTNATANAAASRTNLGLGASKLSPTLTNITGLTSVTLESGRALEVSILSSGGWGASNIITLPTNSPQHNDIVTIFFQRSVSSTPAIVQNTGGLGGPWYIYVGNEAKWIYDTNAAPARWQPLGRTVRAQINYLGDDASSTRINLGLGETNSVTFSALTLSSDLTLGSGDNIVLSTTTGTKIGTATNQLLGFYNQTPITRPSSTGVTTNGFTAGGGTGVHPNSTFTGGIGTNAYTISDVVAHLKSLGLLAP